MSPPQSRRGSSRTAPPDRSSQADRPSRKSPQAACPHQKSRIDPSYPHPRILLRGLDSHKFRKGRYFSSCPKVVETATKVVETANIAPVVVTRCLSSAEIGRGQRT